MRKLDRDNAGSPYARPAVQLGPIVVIPGSTSDIELRVDRARAAEAPSARLVPAAAIQALLRHGLVSPVGLGRLLPHEAGDSRAKPCVAPARLEQGYRVTAVLAEPSGRGGAARSPANDDDVRLLHPTFSRSRCSHSALMLSLVSRLPSWLQPGGLAM